VKGKSNQEKRNNKCKNQKNIEETNKNQKHTTAIHQKTLGETKKNKKTKIWGD